MIFKFYDLDGDLCVMKFDRLRTESLDVDHQIYAIVGLYDSVSAEGEEHMEPLAWFGSRHKAGQVLNEIVTKIAINAPVCDLTEYRWQSATDGVPAAMLKAICYCLSGKTPAAEAWNQRAEYDKPPLPEGAGL